MFTMTSIVTKTNRMLVRVGCALVLAALVWNIGLAAAHADGPASAWQPSAAYLAAQTRFLNFKAAQHEQYLASVGRSWSRVVPSPQERYSAWKYQLSIEADGSRYAPHGIYPR